MSLTVTGPGGTDTATRTDYIRVTAPAEPVAAFTGSPTSGEEPLAVSFTNSSTGAITSYAWSFGDGGTSTARDPSHTYTAPGQYTVSLKVIGPGGSSTSTRTNYITVTAPATESTGPQRAPSLLLSIRGLVIVTLPRMQEQPLAT